MLENFEGDFLKSNKLFSDFEFVKSAKKTFFRVEWVKKNVSHPDMDNFFHLQNAAMK